MASQLKVIWLLQVAWFYWQPAISKLAQKFPRTKVLTALWPGYAKGFEDSIDIQVVGQRKVLEMQPGTSGYGSTFTYVTPSVTWPLIQFWPQVIFTNAFGIWTLIAVSLKLFLGWKVIIAYEGSSPGVDFRNSQFRLFLRRIMGTIADACISNSQSGKEYLIDILGLSPEKVFAYPYEVPAAESLLSDSIETSDFNLSNQRPIFLFVGRIMPRKGLRYLLEAAITLKERGYTNYTILIVGDGEQQEELQSFSQANKLDDCVEWVGRVAYERISAYFQNADIFVLPTLEDTWGVVVLEAMLFGKPVLCSDGAGSSELIEDGHNGYVFSPKDSAHLADIMSKFIDDHTLADAMGKNAKQVMESYAPESSAQFLEQVIGYVCDRQTVNMTLSSEKENLA